MNKTNNHVIPTSFLDGQSMLSLAKLLLFLVLAPPSVIPLALRRQLLRNPDPVAAGLRRFLPCRLYPSSGPPRVSVLGLPTSLGHQDP
jgi:hypothetical protein